MNKKKILVIEDEKDMAYGLEKHLKANKFEVQMAYEGREGLSQAVNNHPDIIILDIMLPGIDGFEVCRKLKLDDKTKEIPIIILSVCFKEGDKQLAYEYGANCYITKPFEARELIKKLNELLSN